MSDRQTTHVQLQGSHRHVVHNEFGLEAGMGLIDWRGFGVEFVEGNRPRSGVPVDLNQVRPVEITHNAYLPHARQQDRHNMLHQAEKGKGK